MRSTQAADGFYEELFPAVDMVRQKPGLFPNYLHGTRRVVLDRYPFSVVFHELHARFRSLPLATQSAVRVIGPAAFSLLGVSNLRPRNALI
jgi:hypothetical protein